MNKKNKTVGIVLLSVFIILVGIIVWGATGYAPCSWYDFNANTTEQISVMESCLKW